ncbi:acyl-CoA desaturase [Thalassobacterium maritimum]
MRKLDHKTNPVEGRVVWAPVKSLWLSFHAVIAVVGGIFTFSYGAVSIAFVFTVATLCLGHSIGLHRLLVHRSFECPRWFEYVLVHLGTVVGMGGPFRILYMHDIRDWSQRHEACHPYFVHQSKIWRDYIWQMHCDLRLKHPPEFKIEPRIAQDRIYQQMQKGWMLQQVPWAVLFYLLGGWPFVIWTVSVRITISLIGHWLVGYFAHNTGQRDWHLQGHAVQGHNLPHIGLLSMGESWHNNHHAYPESAKLGLRASQHDPGWWALQALQAIGLVWKLKLPRDLPGRPELKAIYGKTK